MTFPKIVILHNIISPYKTELFNALCDLRKDFEVLYISENEQRREWKVSRGDLKFPHRVMFQQPANAVSVVSLFIQTWKWLNRLRPEVVYVDGYSYSSCWASLLWARFSGKKTILLSSSTFEDHQRSILREMVKRIFVALCDIYNTYGSRSRDYLISLGANASRITMIGNTTDNDFYSRQTAKSKSERHTVAERLNVSSRNFLYIGRFSPEKNVFMLLKAYRALKSKGFEEWGLILVGNGPLKEEMSEFAKTENLSGISMPGFVHKKDVSEFFAVSDIFVLPSLSESWGLVVNEAMAAGLPVLVSTNCGCSPDLVKEGGNGFGFDPHDVDQLAGLMLAIAGGKYDLEAMGRVSLEIIGKFTPQNAAVLISETIEQVEL